MRVLRIGDSGPDVKRWQFFLRGQGFDPGPADGIFGAPTKEASVSFQLRHGLVADGVVGNRSIGQAMMMGLAVAEDSSEERSSPSFPPPPAFAPLVGLAARQKVFGKFKFVHEPIPGNPENIRVLDNWA